MNMARETKLAALKAVDMDIAFINAQCQLEEVRNLVWAANELLSDSTYNPPITDSEIKARTSSVLRASFHIMDELAELLGKMERTTHETDHQ